MNYDAANIKSLIIDLRSPPSGFPKFNMDYNFFIDEDDKTYGDVTAYATARALGHPRRIPNFLQNGGDLFDMFLRYTKLPRDIATALVWPKELIDSDYDISLIKGDEMAEVLQAFLDRGVVDYRRIKLVPEDDPHFQARYTDEGIARRVDDFIETYGGR